MNLPARLPCPCGTEISPIAWRAHSKSYRYRLRCPRCGLQALVASVRHERAVEMWNEVVVLKRDQIKRGTVNVR